MWAIALALTAAVAAGAGEAIARLAGVRTFAVRIESGAYLGWAAPDPVLGWRNNPGAHPADESPHETMTIQQDGARATGVPGAGPTVLIVGCSYAEGYGVRDDEAFAWRLQQRFPELRIRNFAAPGYGTYQSLLKLRDLIERQGVRPALVIYGFLPFHAERNVLTYSMLDAFRAFGGERFSPPHVELSKGALAAYPPFVVHDWPLERHSALVTLMHRSGLRLRLAGREQQETPVTNLLLTQMKQLVEGAHGRLLVATLWNGGDLASFPQIRAGMKQAGIEELDVTYDGEEKRPEKILVGGYGHPGPLIHAWWADKLAHWMAEQGIAR
jgi:hypothetical protein